MKVWIRKSVRGENKSIGKIIIAGVLLEEHRYVRVVQTWMENQSAW